MNAGSPPRGVRLPGAPPDEITLEVVEVLTEGPGRGDFALCVRVGTPHLHFQGDHLWVEQTGFGAFLAEFEILARTRLGRARLPFAGGHVLTFFSLPGTADLAVRGRFTSHTRVGSATLPTVVDFHASLGGEFVEGTWADFRRLLDGALP